MAEGGAWPSIQQIGLRTTRQLVEESDAGQDARQEILGQRRRDSVRLSHDRVGPVVVRDQRPLQVHNLESALTDMSVPQWLDVLNDRVFFWAHPARLERLLSARPYRGLTHDVLVLDTAALLERHLDRVRLTGMNTGATIFPNPVRRGSDTFQTVEAFPFSARRAAGRRLVDNVVEVCVLDGVDDVLDLVNRVERVRGGEVLETLFIR